MSRILDRISGLFARTQSSSANTADLRKSPLKPRKSTTILGAMPALSGAIATVTPGASDAPAVAGDQATNLRTIIDEAENSTPSTSSPPQGGSARKITDPVISREEAPEPEIVTRPTSVRDLFPSSRKRERQEMQARSYDQVIGLIERIGKHLDTQAVRSDRMVTLLERLPDAINALPEIQRNSEQLTSAIETHFAKQHDRDLQLQATIEELGVGAARQAEALTLIHQEVQAGHQREAEMTGVMADFRQTLSNLDHTNEQSVNVLKSLVLSSKDHQSKFVDILSRQNRTLMIVAGAAVISSLAGLTIAVIALIKVAGV